MKITMLGHSCLLIEINGKRILTDPWLSNSTYFNKLKHIGDYPEKYDILPLDLILVSHGHDDHFDPNSLIDLPKSIPVIIYSSYEKKAIKAGFNRVIPVTEGVLTTINELEILAMPGKHFGGISTFMITGNNNKIFFGGDSEYLYELEDALKDTEPDIALLPISGGGIGPLKFHMGPQDAANLIIKSKAKVTIPTHYHFDTGNDFFNSFLMRSDCLNEFKEIMAQKSPDILVKVLDYGKSYES